MRSNSNLSPLFALLRVSVLLLWLSPLNAQTNTSQRELTAFPPPANAPTHGGYYALIIGVSNYGNGLDKLRTPINDARDVAAVLQNNYGFVTKLLPEATRDQILDALAGYRRDLRADDSLLIYYAGHGWRDKEADLAYWIPVDGKADSHSRWIEATEITGAARAMQARHVLIISDSCYSGRLTDRAVSPTFGDPRERTAFLEKMQRATSRHVMSSGGDEPVSDVDAPGHSSNHSVFANALLQGLKQTQTREFTARELFNEYIHEQVGGRSNQVPEFNPIRNSGHDSGDFIFFRAEYPNFAGRWVESKLLQHKLFLGEAEDLPELEIRQDGAQLSVVASGLPWGVAGGSFFGMHTYDLTINSTVASGTVQCGKGSKIGLARLKDLRLIEIELKGSRLYFTTRSCFSGDESPFDLFGDSIVMIFKRADAGLK